MRVVDAVRRIDSTNALLVAYEPSDLQAQLWAWVWMMIEVAHAEGWIE